MYQYSSRLLDRRQGGWLPLPPTSLLAVVLAVLGLLVQHKGKDLAAYLSNSLRGLAATKHPVAASISAFCALDRQPYVCAHGGDTTQHPPNTAAAYAAAIAAGADCIELDVSLTADQQLVALHQNHLQQLLKKSSAQVHDFTLQQLRSTTWPGGELLLSFTEALKLTAPLVELVILDVKVQQPSEPGAEPTAEESMLVDALLPLLNTAGYSNTLVWGKSDAVAQLVKKAATGQRTGYTVMFDHRGTAPHFEEPLRETMCEIEVAAVYHDMLNASLMDQLQSASKSVFVWSVDELAQVTRVLNFGIHGIVTDKPGMLLRAVKERWSRCLKAS